MSSARMLRPRVPPPTLASTTKRKRRGSEGVAPTKKARVTAAIATSKGKPRSGGKAKPKSGEKTKAGNKPTRPAAKATSKAPAGPRPQGPVLRPDIDYDEEEGNSEAEEDEDNMAEEQLGEDNMDYAEDVDLWDRQETAQWGRKSATLLKPSMEGAEPAGELFSGNSDSGRADEQNGTGDSVEKRRSRLKKNERVKQKQRAERPQWIPQSKETEIDLTLDTDDEEDEEDESDSEAQPAGNIDFDEDSIDIHIAPGDRYPALKAQPPRLKRVIRKAFSITESKMAFDTAYPPPEDGNRFYRNALRDAARELGDEELAKEFKSNAPYGNTIAHLVKGRFSKHRLALRHHATSEAKLAYRLQDGCGAAAQNLLLDDNFVYNFDAQGRAMTSEPYRHPAILTMVQFFFKGPKSVGQRHDGMFKSTILPEKDQAASEEKEVPIPMVAISAAMLRAELSLWKFDRRDSAKFDADQHYTAYEHHVKALKVLQQNFPMRFHRLMAFLHTQAVSSVSLSAPKGCDGVGVLGILGWEEDEPASSMPHT